MGFFRDFFSRPSAGQAAPAPSPSINAPERRSSVRPRIAIGCNVLIVDDSKTIVAALGRMLMQNNFEVHAALSAEEALDLAKSIPFQLIFLDIVLPGRSGFEALREIRKFPAARETPIIMMSGNAQATEQFYAKRIGADDFMRKPFSRAEVFARVYRFLDNEGVPRRLPA